MDGIYHIYSDYLSLTKNAPGTSEAASQLPHAGFMWETRENEKVYMRVRRKLDKLPKGRSTEG